MIQLVASGCNFFVCLPCSGHLEFAPVVVMAMWRFHSPGLNVKFLFMLFVFLMIWSEPCGSKMNWCIDPFSMGFFMVCFSVCFLPCC